MGKVSVILLLLYFINCDTEPRILAISVIDSANFVIRDNAYTFKAEQENIILYGSDLDSISTIELSATKMKYGENCDDERLPFFLHINNSLIDENEIILLVPKNEIFPINIDLYLCINYHSKNVLSVSKWVHQGDEIILRMEDSEFEVPFWASIIIVICLVSLSGIFSGLNIGLMGLTCHELELIKKSGTIREQNHAEKILPLRRKENVLLCAILIGVSVLNSASTVFIDDLTTSAVAVVIATLVIVLFSEIIPQSICTRYALEVSAYTNMLTWIILIISFPISYPLGKLLDCVLGQETPRMYNRQQLLEVFKLNCQENLEPDEAGIIFGGLNLKKKRVIDLMTPVDKCFMISISSILDFKTMSNIVSSGFSRIPVYNGNYKDIVGILYLKDLTFIDTEDMIPLSHIIKHYNHPIIKAVKDTTIDKVLREFRRGRSHLAIVVDCKRNESNTSIYEPIGIITFENIVEEIIQSEIHDENDKEKFKREKYLNSFSGSKVNAAGVVARNLQNIDNNLTEDMAESICDFLRKTIECFKPTNISKEILKKLVMHKGIAIYIEYGPKEVYLYRRNIAADYFVLIIEGKVEVSFGAENLLSVQGALSYFGQTCLIPENASSLGANNEINNQKFLPDFSVKIIESVLILRIPSSFYKIAVQSLRMSSAKDSKNNFDIQSKDNEKLEEKSPEFPELIDFGTNTGPLSPTSLKKI